MINRIAMLTILSLLVLAAPASAQTVELNEPCTNASGLPVITPEEGFSGDLDTPVGTPAIDVSTVDGGDYLIDLAGLPVGTRKTVNTTVAWTAVGVNASDYDMVVNGTAYQAVGPSETASISRTHCQTISVDEVYAYIGVPTDSLTIDVSISSFGF